jgi:uncharacterized protein YdeI (YjbR/CyaY-like superfamily)
MAKKDPRIDTVIERAAPFAQPILTRLRKVMHAALPEVEEDLKWRHPTFVHQGILAGMAAFKKYCSLGFWKQDLLLTRLPAADRKALESMGKLTSVEELPSDAAMIRIIKVAAKMNEDGVKVARPKPRPASERVVETPAFLQAALKKNAKARAAYEAFSFSHRKEYVDWLNDAKTDETRARRLASALEWMAEGKSRNWKYQRR